MDYRFYFFCLVSFFAGWTLKSFKIYIGTDKKKYEEAAIGILLRR